MANQKMNEIHNPLICEGIGPSPTVGLIMHEIIGNELF